MHRAEIRHMAEECPTVAHLDLAVAGLALPDQHHIRQVKIAYGCLDKIGHASPAVGVDRGLSVRPPKTVDLAGVVTADVERALQELDSRLDEIEVRPWRPAIVEPVYEALDRQGRGQKVGVDKAADAVDFAGAAVLPDGVNIP